MFGNQLVTAQSVYTVGYVIGQASPFLVLFSLKSLRFDPHSGACKPSVDQGVAATGHSNGKFGPFTPYLRCHRS
jgi:hypothetical protein